MIEHPMAIHQMIVGLMMAVVAGGSLLIAAVTTDR